MTLQQTLQARFDPGLATAAAGPITVVLAPALHAKVAFDAIAQAYTWAVSDAVGRWIGLSLAHEEGRALTAARLQRISELGDVVLVLANAHLDRTRFALEPVAVVGRMPSGGKAELLNLDLESRGTELPSSAMRADWLDLLARTAEGAPPVLARLERAGDAGATAKLLAQCADTLLSFAELGTLPWQRQSAELAGLAQRLEAAGLLPLADAVAAAHGARSEAAAAALLRAVNILDRTCAHARRLAWLQPVPN
jgi:hypothetical protein